MVDVALIPAPIGPQFKTAGVDQVIFQVDCGVSYLHSQTANIAEHPIETGSNISDHRQINRPRLRLEGINVGGPFTAEDADESTGVEHFDAYVKLLELFEGEAVFDVVTPLRTYSNMQMASISVPQAKEQGNSLEFTIELVQVLFVQSETVTLRPSAATKKPKTRRGKKPTTTAPSEAAEGSRSVLSGLFSSGVSTSIAGG